MGGDCWLKMERRGRENMTAAKAQREGVVGGGYVFAWMAFNVTFV